jgi:hypothetical protein
MTDKTDIFLFTYALIVVGFVAGLRMLYAGAIERHALLVGGKSIEPKQLVAVGSIFSSAGMLAVAVMIVEILSGAGGTVLWPFIVATVAIPPVVLFTFAREN